MPHTSWGRFVAAGEKTYKEGDACKMVKRYFTITRHPDPEKTADGLVFNPNYGINAFSSILNVEKKNAKSMRNLWKGPSFWAKSKSFT